MNKINLRRMNDYNNYNKNIADKLYLGNLITQTQKNRILDIVEELESFYRSIKSQRWSNIEIIGVNE